VILLVRHAVAVARRTWSGPDEARPLNARGLRQARRLPGVLADYKVARVLTSPAVRCVATVAPLAESLGLDLETTGVLREGRGDRALDLVLDLVEDVALCSHGDVIDEVLAGVRSLGWPVPEGAAAAKGSVWVLAPRPTCAYLPPPA